MVTHDRQSEFDKADIKIQLLDRRKQSTDLNFCNKYKDCQRKQEENFIIRHFLFDIRYSAYCSRGFGPLFISPPAPPSITAFGSRPLSATHDLLYYRFQPKAKIGNLLHRGPDSCPQSAQTKGNGLWRAVPILANPASEFGGFRPPILSQRHWGESGGRNGLG